ncbi:hypothetical protein NLI96_g1671 [Meripilus lineatus]|uniref:Cytochrome P450 n=1 Tax=Meripilus lineatus TaxID=2056292 RepID=A0AAD5VC49_9APHY|nr:hypothetical protein NLI96_g1671 [Physisporinus lineatus]
MTILSVLVQGAALYGATWVLWHSLRKLFTHGPLDNIPGPDSASFFTGNLAQLFKRSGWEFHDKIMTHGPVSKVHSLFGDKMLFVYDPKALHQIVVKEQYTYEETPIFLKINHLMFGPGLLSTLGEHHRHQRKMLNPVFHINHMRYMEPIFYEITHKLRGALIRQVENGSREIDVLGWMTRTALELVGQGGLGHSFDELDDDVPNPFAEALKSLVPVMAPMFLIVRLLPFVVNIGPASVRRWIVERLPLKNVQAARKLSDLMDKTSREILASKRKALVEGDEAVHRQVGAGKDIMSVLLQANMHASDEDRLPDAELLGHMSTFLFAAMETTSGALVHILHMLAEHPVEQEKLRQEILKAQVDGGDIPYDELVALPYLEAVCRETLRLHSPVTALSRRTQKDMVLPLSSPIRGTDGSMINEVPVPKDTDVMIGIMACNKNPALWGPDANEWKPERWLSPLPESITEAHVPGVYSNLMTFLGGGRACIGFKFSQLEMKVVLSVLLSTFKFEMSSKEIFWNFAGVQYPTTGTKSNKAEMFLRVSLHKST